MGETGTTHSKDQSQGKCLKATLPPQAHVVPTPPPSPSGHMLRATSTQTQHHPGKGPQESETQMPLSLMSQMTKACGGEARPRIPF